MKKQILIGFILLTTVLGTAGFSQTVYYDRNRLDSLLLAGDAKSFLALWEKLSAQAGMENMCNEEDAECFSNLHMKLSQVMTATEGRIQELCGNFEKAYASSSIASPGDKAALAYKKFEEAAKTGNYQQAVEYYFIAVSLSNRHYLSEKRRLRENYTHADNLRAGGKYDEALALIGDFRKEDPANRAYSTLCDSLTYLYNELERKTQRERGRLRLETEGGTVQKRLSITLAYNLLDRAGNKEDMNLRNRVLGPGNDIGIGHTRSSNAGGIKASIQYHFSPAFALGATTTYSQIYNVKITTQYILGPKDTEELHGLGKAFSLGLIGTYYLREISGLRPYIRLEAGAINVRRSKIEVDPNYFRSYEYTSVWEANVNYPQVGAEFGGEFEFSPRGLFFLGIHFYAHNHFGDTTLLKHYDFGVGVSGGINVF